MVVASLEAVNSGKKAFCLARIINKVGAHVRRRLQQWDTG